MLNLGDKGVTVILMLAEFQDWVNVIGCVFDWSVFLLPYWLQEPND